MPSRACFALGSLRFDDKPSVFELIICLATFSCAFGGNLEVNFVFSLEDTFSAYSNLVAFSNSARLNVTLSSFPVVSSNLSIENSILPVVFSVC